MFPETPHAMGAILDSNNDLNSRNPHANAGRGTQVWLARSKVLRRNESAGEGLRILAGVNFSTSRRRSRGPFAIGKVLQRSAYFSRALWGTAVTEQILPPLPLLTRPAALAAASSANPPTLIRSMTALDPNRSVAKGRYRAGKIW